MRARTVFAMRLCGVALGLVGLALMPALAPAATAPEPSSAMKAEIESDYGKLPLSFEANQGQTDSQVKFLARGRGYALFLTPTEAVLSLAKPQAQARAETSATSSPEAVLAMQLAGANLEPQVTGQDALPGRVNYLRGKDPAHWQTQIPTYAKVAYEGIYPGVDLVYYGNQGQLEYDFVVAPGADPGVLKLVFRGADRTGINPAGELVLSTASGDIRMHAPVIYQETAGVRTTVAGGYVLKEPQQVSFAVAAYDTSRPLVIDPVLVYSTYLGGNAGDVGDQGNGIAVDNRGNAYVTGFTGSTDFPTVNAVQPAFGGGADAFMAKLTRSGSQLLYSTYLGGSGFELGSGIAVDNRGNAYVTGQTNSTDFPTVNAVQPAFGGGADAFVAKLGS
jgi:Beta-propeller repeat